MALDDARAKNQRVLIHCIQGISRSATVVIAYCMKTFGWTLKHSYEYVKGRRSIVSPNVGFVNQLREMEIAILAVTEPSLTIRDVYPIEIDQTQEQDLQQSIAAD
jgi:protein-tyrosine phosphatase